VQISVETESEADKSKAPVPSFAPSKWETVDEAELEAQGDVSVLLIVVKNLLHLLCFFVAVVSNSNPR